MIDDDQTDDRDYDQPVTMQLRTPIDNGTGGVIESLTFRPFTGKDQRRVHDAPGKEGALSMEIMGWLCGEFPRILDDLSGRDLAEANRIVGKLLQGCQ